jgi:prepilin-type N-terminal cleavage/methylation domain-containing protein
MTKRRNDEITKGFSLIELIVVISIIAIVSVSGVVGFRQMGDTLRTREAKGIIEDTIKKIELEILKEDYKKSTIHFMSDYLVIVSEPKDATLSLTFNFPNNIDYDAGNLIKTDGDGGRLEIKTVTAGNENITDFGNSAETEWQYQLSSGGGVSDVIRFVHFNINRENPSGITLSGGEGRTVAIEAPYVKKTITDGTFDITVTSPEEHTETLTIQ